MTYRDGASARLLGLFGSAEVKRGGDGTGSGLGTGTEAVQRSSGIVVVVVVVAVVAVAVEAACIYLLLSAGSEGGAERLQ